MESCLYRFDVSIRRKTNFSSSGHLMVNLAEKEK
jgi:hypothetical protein